MGNGWPEMTNEAENKVYCSFCGKSQDEVEIIIATHLATQVYICSECVALCSNIIAEWVEKQKLVK